MSEFNNNQAGYEMDWDGPIEQDSTFTLLPEGDYDFEVMGFERARHNGSAKLPACNKAIVDIKLTSPEGLSSTIKHNFFLHSSVEGILTAFFTSIGDRKKGEKINMNWPNAIGKKGRCKVGIRKYTNNNGDERESNQINRFYDPVEQQVQTSQQQSFQAGVF